MRSNSLLPLLFLILLFSGALFGQDVEPEPEPKSALGEAHLSRFGAGDGPTVVSDVTRLLDGKGSFGQSNAIAWDAVAEDAREAITLRCRVRITEGGDGAAVCFLNTAEYGVRGPAPFVANWVEPNLRKSFAIGIDVHNPKNEEPFGEWGNYLGRPEREVSLHWDGRELVKRTVESEFRGEWVDLEVRQRFVCGGAEVSVRIRESAVYEQFFIAGVRPYAARLAFGAGTRADVATEFDVTAITLERGAKAAPERQPLHVDLFNHVLTDNSKTTFESEVDLPPLDWAFGRIILTLEIHDAGSDWDEWDRNGHFFVWDSEGNKRDIAPFITSYRTECQWKVDVTHFRPWLTGKTRFEIAAGTTFYKNRGYMMSASLDYYHGETMLGDRKLEAHRIEPLWVGTARYRSDENHFADFFTPRSVTFPDDTAAARIWSTTTGHSQVGEFTPSERAIVFQPDGTAESDAVRFENTLWKSDCYLNPNRPQFGTWKYARAGWAPGDIVHPWWIDLSPHLQPGKTAELRYEPEPYDFSELDEDKRPDPKQVGQASHVIRSYLILYRETPPKVAAPILRVTNVAGGSNAAKVGVKAGDYFASYDGVIIDSIDQLSAAKKAASEAGKESVEVVIYRGVERLVLEFPVGQLGVNLSVR